MNLIFNEVFLFILGFKQRVGKRSPGLMRTWEGQRRFASRERLICTPLSWDTNWKYHAEFLSKYTVPETKFYVAAYSWGAGWGFRNLAIQLKKRNRLIEHAILVDPVYRSKLFPPAMWFMNPISMTKLGKIHVPDNVKEVTYFLQRKNRPCGREVVGNEDTVINPPTILGVKHEHMDDHLLVMDAVVKHFTPTEALIGMGKGL